MMTTPYFDGEGIRYVHPELVPEYSSADIVIYRTHPNHGVAIVKPGDRDQLIVSHVTYARGLEQDAMNMDRIDASGRETMYTDVASDVTAFIDELCERYMQQSKLSELMRDQMRDPYDF